MVTNRVGSKIRPYLDKAKESALLAVEVYNKPGTEFKSAAYIVLMIIAWTSLFHAIFLQQGKKPYKKKKNGRFEITDGDYRHWQLIDCVNTYWKNNVNHPVRKNLELFIQLRNKIEHRQLPEVDSSIFGECQALLLNFDSLLEKFFGSKHQLREVLSFSLQMFPARLSFSESAKKAIKNTKEIKKFIENYRSTLDTSVFSSEEFAFKAFLIQVPNHHSRSALAIQFVKYDQLSPDQQKQIDLSTVAIKQKIQNVSNTGLIKPRDVVTKVKTQLGKNFSVNLHTRCWKLYEVRPQKGSKNPENTITKYCVYDALHEDYAYTPEWVDYLVSKLKDDSEYNTLVNQNQNNFP